MSSHPALTAGRVAVITGAASGIGLAAAQRFAGIGLKVCLADLSGEALDRAAAQVAAASPAGRAGVITVPTDVSRLEDVRALKEAVYAAFGEVGVLMNNAGTAPGGGPWEHICPDDAGAGDRVCGRQHRIQAGHHMPTGGHRVQRQQGWGESADGGARAQPAQR
jgi:NAD(P)-dependent dehydrogenase (short-subunit alcohol dehydrogenase family)